MARASRGVLTRSSRACGRGERLPVAVPVPAGERRARAERQQLHLRDGTSLFAHSLRARTLAPCVCKVRPRCAVPGCSPCVRVAVPTAEASARS